MNIICIQVGYMAGAGISWLARINDYMDPTDVGGPATPRAVRDWRCVPFYALLFVSLCSLPPRARVYALRIYARVITKYPANGKGISFTATCECASHPPLLILS